MVIIVCLEVLIALSTHKNISGNAQRLKLELINQSEIIPVSRNYIPIIKQFILYNS